MSNSGYNQLTKYYGMNATVSIDRRQKILDMMRLQDAINRKIDVDWALQGREWYRAVWIECAELMEHYGGWKWWKKEHPDMDQVLLEVVDIWHFGLSSLLVRDSDWSIIAAEVDQQWDNQSDVMDFHRSVEGLAEGALRTKEFSIKFFGAVLRSCEFSFEDLYKSYIGKNVLNRFRQDNGYKKGTYTKMWNGKEDNAVLGEILKDLSIEVEDFESAVYAGLEFKYPDA